MIYVENSNCGQANVGPGEKLHAAPYEMIFPGISTRVVQPYNQARIRYDAGDIWAFVAVVAGEGEIRFLSWTPVLSRDNVIDLEGQ